MIADDDPVSRRLLERTLARLGHEVVAVNDGSAAVEHLLVPDAPRLAILDWMMPGTDGLAVCRAVRQRTEHYIYVILLTARDRHEDMVAALDAEADDFLTKPVDSVELRVRLRSGERVLSLQERLLEIQAALQHQASHDPLTGLWNRRTILAELDRELERSSRERRSCSVVVADLDHFKLVNDTHGHVVGDTVLQVAAARIQSGLREYDKLGRYGGEEFLFVLPGCDQREACEVAERARRAVAETAVDFPHAQVSITVSLGVASTSGHEREAVKLVEAADAALYRAKADGRNRVAAAPTVPAA